MVSFRIKLGNLFPRDKAEDKASAVVLSRLSTFAKDPRTISLSNESGRLFGMDFNEVIKAFAETARLSSDGRFVLFGWTERGLPENLDSAIRFFEDGFLGMRGCHAFSKAVRMAEEDLAFCL